ncbi:MAG: chromate transporter [Paludibacteraceae bacterium]|nr:chromate transporter [Paludibacteraceae bacterium]
MIYWQLFLAFMRVGFLGFGGGMAIISLIRSEVLEHGWMTDQEFVDIVAISQMTPGPIGMNCATYVGYTATGSVWGSLLASFAIILPSLIIMSVICRIYDKLQAKWSENKVYQTAMRIIRILVVLLVAYAAWSLMNPASFIDSRSWVIFALVLVCSILPDMTAKTRLKGSRAVNIVSHPMLLILLAGVLGYLMYC